MIRTHRNTTHFNYQTDSNHTNSYNLLIKQLYNSNQVAHSELSWWRFVPVEFIVLFLKKLMTFSAFSLIEMFREFYHMWYHCTDLIDLPFCIFFPWFFVFSLSLSIICLCNKAYSKNKNKRNKHA